MLIQKSHIKLSILLISTIYSWITLLNTLNYSTFSSTSILYLLSFISELNTFEIAKEHKLYKKAFYILVTQILVVCTLIGSQLGLPNSTKIVGFWLIIPKILVLLLTAYGIVIYSRLSGAFNTDEEEIKRNEARNIVEKSTEEFHNDMLDRQEKYKIGYIEHARNMSYKRKSPKKGKNL